MASGKTEGEDVSIVKILETIQTLEKLGISNNELLENMIAKLKAKLSQAVSTPSCTGGQRAGQVRISKII